MLTISTILNRSRRSNYTYAFNQQQRKLSKISDFCSNFFELIRPSLSSALFSVGYVY